ncbi:Predicted PurR-regulated permease PerM [Saccharicrinis carchari]|uniref:Predicted PurR-regulated permease PerM n=1 Tax=Saccharicrinis carchari TaxID=1168039 RepID=A0A521CFS0_SACCC|nr:AI-2E family transporter [Saccharicrinis carchari]SMO58276.1 Predicted PurR-regulated permease PerM [Saccharicrinis carchari]
MKNDILLKTALSLFILSIVLVIAILAKNVLVPFVISVFIMYLLYPLVSKLERNGVHRIIAIILVLFVTVIVVGGISVFVAVQVSNTSVDFSEIKQQLDTKADDVQGFLADKLGVNTSTMDHYLSQVSDNLLSFVENKAGTLFSATTTTLFQLFVLPVFVFFMLYYRTKVAYFIFRLVGRKHKTKAVHVLRQISTVTARYMAGLFIVVLILAVLNVSGLLIIGVRYAIIFGIIAAVLNIIPYFGTFIGGSLPVLYVLLSEPDPFSTVLKIIILFSAVQFLENNLITPNIVSNNIKLNPLAIIISLLLGNLIWGMGGMLIAVPMLAIVKIIMHNVDDLKPFAYLIGTHGVEKHSIKIKPIWKSMRKFIGYEKK